MDKPKNPFLTNLRLPVKTSPTIAILVIFAHIISLYLPWMSGLHFSAKLLLNGLLLFSLFYYVAKYYFISTESRISELILNADDAWQVKMANGQSYPAVLGSVSFVHPLLTIITLTFNQSKKHFIFTKEIIDPDQFRRLRVRLRFKVD